MSAPALSGGATPIERTDVEVIERDTEDDLAHIQEVWPSFEALVGLRGRKMFAKVDLSANRYTVCTPLRPDDPPDHFGLQLGVLPGGRYLRGRIIGEPPGSYERIAPGMQELLSMAEVDEARPLVEYYQRRDRIELWVPVR